MIRPTVLTACCAAVLAGAAPASAATVGPQRVVATAGEKSPVLIPGARTGKGTALRKGQTMVARTVTLAGREQPRFRVSCPAGSVLRGLGPDDRGVGFFITDRGSYLAKRRVGLRAYAFDRDAGRVSGTIYGLCRKA